MTERWLAVVGYEGLYEVSDGGQVRSLDRIDGRGWRIKGRMLRPRPLPTGYLRVNLWQWGRGSDRTVHRLVLEAFVGPCPAGMETRHLNGSRADNRLVNLTWGTPVDNAADRTRHGTSGRPRPATCIHGHDLTDPGNLTVAEKCRTCQRRRTREYMTRYRATKETKVTA